MSGRSKLSRQPRASRFPALASSAAPDAPGAGIMLDGMKLVFDERVALAPTEARMILGPPTAPAAHEPAALSRRR